MAIARTRPLDPAKQDRLLAACTRELAAAGYRGASLNRILEEAGVGKSTAYHYFHDKADLCAWAITRQWTAFVADEGIGGGEFTAESFWPQLRSAYLAQLAPRGDAPSLWALLRAMREMREVESTDAFAIPLGWITDLLEHGQRIGAVRSDIPGGLLLDLIAAVDQAADRWMQRNRGAGDDTEFEHPAAEVFAAIQRVAAP